VLTIAGAEALALVAATVAPQLVTRIAVVPRHAPMAVVSQVAPVLAVGPDGCHCGRAGGGTVPLPRHLAVNADIALINSRFDEPRVSMGFEDAPDSYRTVGVIGGGTAGYFAALALNAKLPHLDVTLVESSSIPIIGVGESTTPDVVFFLHGDLGLDLHEFYCTVRPTWKMGIKFFWGKPGDYYFNEPFARPRHSEALHYDGDINTSSVVSRLMSKELGPMIDTDRGPVFLIDRLVQPKATHTHWCAYHLDNKRFVGYLAEQARRRGIPYIDAKIQGAVKTPDGHEIDYLMTEDGRKLKFDLYIDCTGFRSALLEKEMGSRYVSFDRSLFTDTAVVADVPNGGHLKPYTLAESMECGWCWNIPQEESDHRGYVFSSSFCSVEDAAAEMRRKNPGMSDYWTVKFRSGRHEEFWKGNVIGIGNSYGFVEPLESTAIQIVIIELQTLIRNFPKRRSEPMARQVLSSKVAGAWDYIRWFLSIHYKFNRKFSNAFWQTCWNDGDISGIADLVALFQERAPLVSRPDADLIRSRLTSDDLTFNLALVDTMLLGQGVPTARLEPPTESREAWRQRGMAADRLLAQSMTQRRALETLRERPEILGAMKVPGII
jgi:tryptophan halogenase